MNGNVKCSILAGMPAPHRPARIGFMLAQLGAHAADLFARHTRELGITPSEAGVIRVINRSPGISQRELADKLGAVQSRVVALIDRLEAAGLVTRTRRPNDRRIQEIELTGAGRTVLASLRRAAEAQEATLTEGLSERQKSQLYRLLTQLGSLRGLDADVHPGYQARDHEADDIDFDAQQ
jgi:DNA-binding MarR family transcriptional regulator